ncbi:putative WD-repeat protein [Pyrenochaeta sp. MPI-SDFR-AT-0127]|nr:putative WD-repeat protein [Pyrenochaeta sp. MPI-SDFR-AT-0127]
MGATVDHQPEPVSFTNDGGRIAIQAGQYNVYGDNLVQVAQDPLVTQLPHAAEASFNSYTKQHEPTCLPNTRVDLLREIYAWAEGRNERCVFWLNGLAGTGKSTIARTVARSYYDRKCLGASFFFTRGGGDAGHAGRFVTSIAVQLAHNIPPSRQHICDAISERSDIASQSLRDQWQHLVLRPLSKLGDNDCSNPFLLVIDALDECDDDNNIRTIVQLLAEARWVGGARLRVFLTSRPEVPIRHGFYQIPDSEHQTFVLHNISPSIVDRDINLYLEFNLQRIGQERCLRAGWPGAEVITQLVQSASGLFIWAATACRFIQEGKRFAAKRLEAILCSDSGVSVAPEMHLNKMYITVLQSSIYDYTDEEREEQCRSLRHVLGSIVVLFSPLSAQSLDRLLDVASEGIRSMLEDLHAILDIPGDEARPLRLHHPSFRDFLLDKDRCGDENYWVDDKQAHQGLTSKCIQLMSSSLKRDICNFVGPGTLVDAVDRLRIVECLPSELQYACLYWIPHLQSSGAQVYDNGHVHLFLQNHFLHWLEALSWAGKLSEGIQAISSLQSVVLKSDCANLSAFVHDMKRFALYNRAVIEQAPLQVYCSALVFTPAMSIVKRQFAEEVPRWIKRLPQVGGEWSALLQTLEAHTGSVYAVAFSPNSEVLASASADSTVKLWDVRTGAVFQTLRGHSESANAVAFSPNGKVLASGSCDRTVILWDVGTGTGLQTLEGHAQDVNTVTFSPNGELVVSASGDCKINLWNASTGALLETLKGHRNTVNAVAFSPDGTVLASASNDRTARVWKMTSGDVLRTLKGHTHSVTAVAFSPDSKVLASASNDSTIKVWHMDTGALLRTLNGHAHLVSALAFSPDSKLLASALKYTTISLWDSTGVLLQNLKGHSRFITALAFSNDGKLLASASRDKTVKLWDAGMSTVRQTLKFKGHSRGITAVKFSPDGKLLASASYDRTVKLWETSTGVIQLNFKGHSYEVNAVAFSPDGKILASASEDKMVMLWTASNGKILRTLKGHRSEVNAVVFSPDGMVVASASEDLTIKIWSVQTGTILQTIGVRSVIHSLEFSQDTTLLKTDHGSFPTSLSPRVHTELSSLPEEVTLKDQWVSHKGKTMLWLPPEYRPSCTAVWKNTVASGNSSGLLLIIEFAF